MDCNTIVNLNTLALYAQSGNLGHSCVCDKLESDIECVFAADVLILAPHYYTSQAAAPSIINKGTDTDTLCMQCHHGTSADSISGSAVSE